MNALKPFFLLIQRPLVLFGAVGWMIVATFLLSALVAPGGDPRLYMDAAYLTVVALSVYTGWVAGACVLELQQAAFSFVLPGRSGRLLPGFLVLGAVVTGFAVAFVNGASPAPQSVPLLFLVGLAAFALGGSIRDPQSDFMTGLGIALLLVAVVASGTLGRLAAGRPAAVAGLAVLLTLVGLYRLFNRPAFRRRTLGGGDRVLAFSLGRLAQTGRSRAVSGGPRKTRWKRGYLGQDLPAWTRAAWHETHGGLTMASVARGLLRSWGLFLLLLIGSRDAAEELGWWKSLCWSLHDAILRSPHSPEYGENGGPFPLVALLILCLGVAMATIRPVTLHAPLLHPLSRRQRSRLAFAGSLADAATLLLVVAPILLLAGHAAGWVLGFESRFDYLPYFFRALLVTLALMPLAYDWRLRFVPGPGSGRPFSVVATVLVQFAFVVAGMLLVSLSGWVFESPGTELLILVTVVLLSRLLHNGRLWNHYRAADLV